MNITATRQGRDRLISLMQIYLQALVQRDFTALKFAPTVKNTENCCEIPIGYGIGRTIKSHCDDGHFFVDVGSGQVEYWGVAQENSRLTILAVRLKVEGRQISEIETFAIRGSGEYFNTEAVCKGTQGFHDIVPEEQRLSRDRLIEIANCYFDGILHSNGEIVQTHETAIRIVNGTAEGGTETTVSSGETAYRALTLKKQIEDGYYSYIEALRDRRFVVVDEERGLVLVHLMFDQPADHSVEDGILPWPEPSTVMAFEVFKVSDGLIREVWALGSNFPYGMRTGW